MSVDFSLLDSGLGVKITNLLENLKKKNYDFRPVQGYRDLATQARYWRQSRTRIEVEQQIEAWKKQGADFLAEALESVGPQNGPHVTNALPGFSWHNHGKAVDCYLYVHGTMVTNGEHPGYKEYADEAKELGLTPGYYFQINGKPFRDSVHVQTEPTGVRNLYTLREINELFKNKYTK